MHDTSQPEPHEGCLITLQSANSPEKTWQLLNAAIASHQQLVIIATLDHGRKTSAEDPVKFNRVMLFDHAQLTGEFIRLQPTFGLDLPFRIQVFEDASANACVAYGDCSALAEQHGLTDQPRLLTESAELFRVLAVSATRKLA